MTAPVLTTALSDIATDIATDAALRRAAMERIGRCDDIADTAAAAALPDLPGRWLPPPFALAVLRRQAAQGIHVYERVEIALAVVAIQGALSGPMPRLAP